MERELTEKEREYAEKMERRSKLMDKIYELYSEVEPFDDGVHFFFDLESDKNLAKKVRVLSALVAGKDPVDMGKDYLDILEGYDWSSIPEGQEVVVSGWRINPQDYK